MPYTFCRSVKPYEYHVDRFNNVPAGSVYIETDILSYDLRSLCSKEEPFYAILMDPPWSHISVQDFVRRAARMASGCTSCSNHSQY